MIQSMTGYGKAICETEGKKITVEIRSLNSKQIDINAKMPWLYKSKEIELRNIISSSLGRGKVDFSVFVDLLGEQAAPQINKSVIKNYYDQLTSIAGELYIDKNEQLLSIIMRMPETLSSVKEELNEDEWLSLKKVTEEAVLTLQNYREEEGKSLMTDLSEHIKNILVLLEEIEPFDLERIENVKEKIRKSLVEAELENIDSNRFEQELIYYLEKLDLNEEKVRLKQNCEYFLETMQQSEANGKKLGFISQEIGREINTIGSKANNAAIQRIVVRMKDELEKIKEQVLNVL